MGFFSKIFGSGRTPSTNSTDKPAASGAERSVQAAALGDKADPVELVPAIAALQADDFERTLQLALPHAAHADSSVRADAHRLCALALSRLDRYADALPHWKQLAMLEPNAHNFQQVATSAAMLHDIEAAEQAFAHALEFSQREHQEGPSPAPMMHVNYASALQRAGRADMAAVHMEQLRDWYIALHITDTTFLYLRGMPFFSTFLENGLPIVRQVLDGPELEGWLNVLHNGIDQEGREQLQAYRAT
jgi:tetratricopeptide (TPR) repeat protein